MIFKGSNLVGCIILDSTILLFDNVVCSNNKFLGTYVNNHSIDMSI